MKQLHLSIFALLLFALSSCTHTPEGVIDAEKITPILEDIHVVDAMLNNSFEQKTDKEKLAYYEHIYQKHHITKEQFDASMAYYAKHPAQLRESYEMIIANLKNRDSILKEKEKILVDTVQLWQEKTAYKIQTESATSVPVCIPVTHKNSYTISAEIRIFEDSKVSEIEPHFVFEAPDTSYVLQTHKILADTAFQKFETSGIVMDSTVLDLAGDFFPLAKDSTTTFKHYEIKNIKITTTKSRSEAELDSIISKKIAK